MARAAFPVGDLAVSGLHTVFGHHAAQGSREALAAFLHENRITLPVAIDRPGDAEGVPKTMPAYGMRGTPTRLLIDRGGRLRKHIFDVEDDLVPGADLMALIMEPREVAVQPDAAWNARRIPPAQQHELSPAWLPAGVGPTKAAREVIAPETRLVPGRLRMSGARPPASDRRRRADSRPPRSRR